MRKPPYRQQDDHWLIELRLKEPRQIFNTIDPSPFHEKDLDDVAERYIVEAVEDFRHDEKLRLVIHLPPEHVNEVTRAQLASAIANYFDWRAHESRHELLQILRIGRISFLIGLGFLAFCMLMRSLASMALPENFISSLLDEGLLIIGWVALWRPIEIFLYDWWPILQSLRTHRRIRALPLALQELD